MPISFLNSIGIEPRNSIVKYEIQRLASISMSPTIALVGHISIQALQLPQWFKDLPFNDAEMEQSVITSKVENLLGVLDWDLESDTNMSTTFDSLFDFE